MDEQGHLQTFGEFLIAKSRFLGGHFPFQSGLPSKPENPKTRQS